MSGRVNSFVLYPLRSSTKWYGLATLGSGILKSSLPEGTSFRSPLTVSVAWLRSLPDHDLNVKESIGTLGSSMGVEFFFGSEAADPPVLLALVKTTATTTVAITKLPTMAPIAQTAAEFFFFFRTWLWPWPAVDGLPPMPERPSTSPGMAPSAIDAALAARVVDLLCGAGLSLRKPKVSSSAPANVGCRSSGAESAGVSSSRLTAFPDDACVAAAVVLADTAASSTSPDGPAAAARTALGTSTTALHLGHLILCPANWSPSWYFALHDGHWQMTGIGRSWSEVIGMDECK